MIIKMRIIICRVGAGAESRAAGTPGVEIFGA